METTVNEVLEAHHAAMASYGELAANGNTTQAALREASDKVKKIGAELSSAIAEGAEVCKQCSQPPMGMLKTPSYYNQGVEVPPVFEVGCVFCPPIVVENSIRGVAMKIDGNVRKVLRRSVSARANTPADAVRKWNASEFVEDTLFDRMPGFTGTPAE
jgi:hypothetical protein